ncbi:MAG: TolC family protein [Candidatus Kapabacteria bacterium]|nr:TolC family protein [Candidatus Kapabacteria bacterium]
METAHGLSSAIPCIRTAIEGRGQGIGPRKGEEEVICRLLVVFFLATCAVSAQDTIGLADFLRRVEVSHPSLRIASYEPDLAEAEIRNALGRFDPRLSATYEYKDKSGIDKVNVLDAAVELPLDLLFGPKVKAQYSRGLGFQIDPQKSTASGGEASIGVSLPLFQGIFTDTRRNALRKAMLRPDMAQAQYRMDRNNLLRTAAARYWDWSEAVSAVAIMDSMLRLAERRLSFIIDRARAGEVAAIDSIDATQEVLRRRGERLRTIRAAEQARIEAAVMLWTTDGLPVIMTGSPLPLPSASDSVLNEASLLTVAKDKRPEIRRAILLQQTTQLDRDLARELLRPFVEADASLISYDIANSTSPDLKVGLKIDQPLLFRSASAQEQVADITVQRADWQRSLVERAVTADVQQAVVAIERGRERLRLAADEVRLASVMVANEERRARAGETDLLTINLRERFLADALLRELAAKADVAKAFLALQWATGTI